MPPELIDALKLIVPSAATGLLGYFGGRSFKKAQTEQIIQSSKTLEFERINDLLNEYQQQNRDLKADMRDLKAELRTIKQERDTENAHYEEKLTKLENQRGIDQDKIRRLERRVGELEREKAALIQLTQDRR